MAFEDSPGLNLGHGFMHYIRQRQFARADEERSFEHLRLRHQAAYIDFSNRSSLVEPPPISHSILKNIQDQKENISLAYEMSSLSVTDKNNNQDQKENTSLASETSSNLVTDKTKSPLKIKKPSRPIYQPPGYKFIVSLFSLVGLIFNFFMLCVIIWYLIIFFIK